MTKRQALQAALEAAKREEERAQAAQEEERRRSESLEFARRFGTLVGTGGGSNQGGSSLLGLSTSAMLTGRSLVEEADEMVRHAVLQMSIEEQARSRARAEAAAARAAEAAAQAVRNRELLETISVSTLSLRAFGGHLLYSPPTSQTQLAFLFPRRTRCRPSPLARRSLRQRAPPRSFSLHSSACLFSPLLFAALSRRKTFRGKKDRQF